MSGRTAQADIGLLPHRAPFLFVDHVVECEPGSSIRARFRVPEDLSVFAGHFPGNPIFPGVLQLEALAQAGAIAVLADARWAGSLPLFGGVDRTRFRRLVRPGDTIDLDVQLERMGTRGGWGQAEASVGGATACNSRMLFVIDPASGS